MIETVASLIEELKNQELIILDKFALKHAPTIGEMYEGLTSDILKKAIPPHLGLQFVSGVIYDNSEKMTKQIDCMLVKGEGIEIPHTGKYKWHIKDVLVVFEVKKTKAKPKARNPKTGEIIFVKPRRKTHFKPGKILKNVLKKPLDEFKNV